MSFRLSDGTVIQIYDYRFVHDDWRPPVEDPPLSWTRLDQGSWEDLGSVVSFNTAASELSAGPEGPRTLVHPLVYSNFRLSIELAAAKAQLAVFQYQASGKPENDEQFNKLVSAANAAFAQTPSTTRNQLVRIEVR